MNRKLNFNAGPAAMPLEVLSQLQEQLVDYHGEGTSMLENSHRGTSFYQMYQETLQLVRELMEIPDDYTILFLGGGATLQFGMIPMNFLPSHGSAEYIKSGSWANKAYDYAVKIGTVTVPYDGKENGYTTLPDPMTLKPAADTAYFYVCSNETIGGIQWKQWPDTGSVPLIADMSSDILSRPVPVEKFSLIFAGSQKNLGPAGATLIIMHKDLLEKTRKDLPAYFQYTSHAKKEGLMNTPPVFAIWAIQCMLNWMKQNGGASGMEKLAEEKASMLYSAIDQSGGFYRSPVESKFRSHMNVVFRLPSEELEKEFISQSQQNDMIGLKGHRSVGGCRASIYNGVPVKSVQVLADFMQEFARRYG